MRAHRFAPLFFACVLACAGCAGYRTVFSMPSPASTVNMLYDDDCDEDLDCVSTQPLIHDWIDLGYVKLWGMVSSGPSNLGAPTMRVFQQYYGHENLFSIGAAVPECALQDSAPWNQAVVARFDPDDTCSNYPECGMTLRQSLANYINSGGAHNGLVYVITGPLTCEERFRTSPADTISPLSGADLERKYIREFVLMNGMAPAGAEQNCREDPFSCSAFFASVTSANGYPPVYDVPLNTGADNVVTQVPIDVLPATDPSVYAFLAVGRNGQTTDEDAMAVEYGVMGSTGWTQSLNATNWVDINSGANVWNTALASGQFYLTPNSSPAYFESIVASPWYNPQ